MLHVVMRPIPGPEGDIPSGTLIDPSSWRNTTALISEKFLRPVTPDDTDGLETVEIDKHGISDINIFEQKRRPLKIPANGAKKKKK